LDAPFLIALADEQAKAGEIVRLVETLDLLAGVAGPQPEVLETFACHRPAIDAALGKGDGALDHPTRAMLSARVRRLWAFLPDLIIDEEEPAPVAPPPRLDAAFLIETAEKYASRADIPNLVETLDILASVVGPKPEVVEALVRYRDTIDAALDSASGVLDRPARTVLAARARRLWVFLPEPSELPTPELPPAALEPDEPSLIRAADEQARLGRTAELVETLDRLAGIAGPQPEVIAVLARHRAAVEAALGQMDGPLDAAVRASLAARARRLWAFLPDDQAAPPVEEPPPFQSDLLDPASLLEAASVYARWGDTANLVKALDALAGIAGPQPEVIDALTRYRPAINAALAKPDHGFDAQTRAVLIARSRRLWAFLPPLEPERPPPVEEPVIPNARLDTPYLLALAAEYGRHEDIPRLVKTLDVLAGVAGPQPEVVEALARYRFAIDTALADREGPLAPQNRAMLAARARRLWTFLPETPAESPPSAPEPSAIPKRQLDPPALIASADEYEQRGDIPSLIETLDVLVGIAGPTAEVAAVLARHRRGIDAALAHADGTLDAQSRAMLGARARRLWAFLPDVREEPVPPPPELPPLPAAPAERPLDAPALVEAAGQRALLGDVPGLVETLDVLAGIAGPTPEVLAALTHHRPTIDAALARDDGPLDAQSRAMLGVRARRLWAFLPEIVAQPAKAVSPEPVVPPPRRRPPDAPALIEAADTHAQQGDIAALVESLDTLVGLAGPQPDVIATLIRHRPTVDAALAQGDGPLDARSRATLAGRARRLWAFLPETSPQPQPKAEPVRPPTPKTVVEKVESRIRRIDPHTWLEAARLAARSEDKETVVACAREAVKAAPGDRTVFKEVTAFLAECGMHEEVIALHRAAYDEAPTNLSLALGLMRAVEASTQPARMFEELQGLVAKMQPFSEFSAANVTAFVEMYRRLATLAERPVHEAQVNALETTLRDCQVPSALLHWALGTLNVWRFDRAAALKELDEALKQPPLPSGTILDLNAERALLFVRYHLYGEALAAMAKVPDRLLRSNAYYQRRLSSVQAVADLCPDAPSPLRYPECLIDVMVDEIARQPITYEPRSRHLVMVSGSLGQGGGERQTITVVKRMITDPRIAKLTLLVRSTHLRPTDDFFLPLVSQLPLDCHIYGKNWYTASNVEKKLPELANRPRLAKAIDLLPQTIREDVVRISRHLLDEKPEAVHIWQDITGAALACLICGVPNFFAHRGSLSPDYWGQTERQTETHFRPMKHTYRRLLERPDFVILNNSDAGNKTDQKWTNWPDSSPFHFLANAIDFSVLGPNTGRNVELRDSLGIPPDALVVGGSFRIFSVKRPEYWIGAAGIIGAAVPNAHFLIIGDGDMTELVQERAKEYGISDRLHLPGRVSNVGDWYRAMDLSLLTSEREGIPNALIEAQHFGVPIVATHVGGIPEAIEMGTTGYTVPGNAPAEYAERVISILRDQDWRASAYVRAQDFVHEKFSLERVIDRLLGYYGFLPRDEAHSDASVGRGGAA
jgi:glycosyltransferase involved in cell wall biosynthesis